MLKRTTFLLLGLTFILGLAINSFADEVTIKNVAKDAPYELNVDPWDIWEDTDGIELTDGIFGSLDFTDPAWQGQHRSDASGHKIITIDLQEPKSIKRIAANYLHDGKNGIRYPLNTTISVSGNGDDWIDLAEIFSKIHVGDANISKQKYM